ncbi:helix-turn-helix domain-containing protein [Anaerorhabdus furcosa]|uniref:DNA-binding transcriptional regulator, XRE-family HTH domain n=1 Tax=Anaerorhabdus furcosa TaxID=118967 RepID=A0A1T4PUV9_9FIRM|nr:helix-turn-helix transcriptional regulator [Anaerorhabdus furcosa]SJZ95323.1 DNA-binding transcriptional regulator, XRE-family HTH domain [Anaerorhabdus furcosa]
MEFQYKLQELRKQKGLTQEELSEVLYVSRTAISKWESGRGYPSIDSLKAISEYFSISIDELLSNKELIRFAEKDSNQKIQRQRDLVFGLLDCSIAMLYFIPIFSYRVDDFVKQVSLFSIENKPDFILISFVSIITLTVLCGITILAMQSSTNEVWNKIKLNLSLVLSIISVVVFLATLQSYPTFYTFVLLIIKGALLIKQ